MSETRKWSCKECDWRGVESELLVAPNPFAADDVVNGCPRCKSIDCFTEACDEAGCWEDAGCGFPTKTGYRRTCFDHSIFKIGASSTRGA